MIDQLTNVELRDKDNLPLDRARTNDKSIIYIVSMRLISEGNVTMIVVTHQSLILEEQRIRHH
mgnify:FL=1